MKNQTWTVTMERKLRTLSLEQLRELQGDFVRQTRPVLGWRARLGAWLIWWDMRAKGPEEEARFLRGSVKGWWATAPTKRKPPGF